MEQFQASFHMAKTQVFFRRFWKKGSIITLVAAFRASSKMRMPLRQIFVQASEASAKRSLLRQFAVTIKTPGIF